MQYVSIALTNTTDLDICQCSKDQFASGKTSMEIDIHDFSLRKATATQVRMAWLDSFAPQFPNLANITARLLMLHATPCSSELMWSLMRWICTDNHAS